MTPVSISRWVDEQDEMGLGWTEEPSGHTRHSKDKTGLSERRLRGKKKNKTEVRLGFNPVLSKSRRGGGLSSHVSTPLLSLGPHLGLPSTHTVSQHFLLSQAACVTFLMTCNRPSSSSLRPQPDFI